MPEGLIPVGNAVHATGNASKAPRPKAPAFDGAAAMSMLRNQYSPLEWTDFFDARELINDTVPFYIAGSQGIVFVCLHGAGHSAMSFAALAEKLKGQHTVCSFDFRGHGGHSREDELEMS